MKKTLLTLLALLTLGVSGAWAQITVSPSTGVYWKNNAVSSDAWAPIWKSTVTASDGSTPLLVMTAGTGIDTSNGDIYASTYTLEVPAGYVISSYTLNGTATGSDVTITPSGESATVISSGNSLADALAVTVRAQSTSFVLAGGYLANVALNVTVSPTPVIVAMTSAGNLPSAYGAFSGQTFTTADASGMAGVTITASTGLTINEATVNVSNYGKCFSLVTAAAATDYTVTMTAPTGYVITGYYLGGSANTKDAPHTLTSADGSVSVVASAPPYNDPTGPKAFEVTGLNTNSTYFTINTANKNNTLYLPTFYIYVAKASEVVDVTYNVMFNGSQVATATVGGNILGNAPALPSSLVKDYCTYTYYSDADCTEEITTLTSGATTVYAKCVAPFEASTSFNSATWYYLKLKNANYPTYVADGTPNVTLPASNAGDRTTQWAFFGNPYDGFTLKNRAAGNDLVLGSASPASDVSTGGATYATLGTSGSQDYEVWYPAHSSSYTNGFFLQTSEGYAINQRSTANMAFWTGGKDSGSTFVVEAAPSDAEYLATLLSTYTIAAASLDKPGFPTTAAYNTFRSAIEAYASIEDAEANLATDLATLKDATVYPNGTYYIKNRNTGCYAFITDDGELVPRIKIDNSVSHANNNYLWTVTSDKSAGTCSIVSSLYSTVPFAKGDNTYANITSSNRTVITTLSTELFSSNNGTTGAFYLNGAHNNNDYATAGNGNSHVVSWNYQNSYGSQWIFEPVDLGTEYTVTVEGLNDGGEDAVTLSDGTIVNLGTGTVYLSETPTTSNITQNEVSGYSIQDGSIVVDTQNHTITVTYSPSYDVLIANYWSDNAIAAKLANAGQYGYPATDNEYTVALNGVATAIAGSSYEGNATNYNNLKTWYEGFLAAAPVVPTSGFLRIKSSALQVSTQPYLIGENHATQTARAAFNASPTDNKDIWYFDGTNLYNYGNGGYPAVNNSNFLGVATTAGATAAAVAFEDNGTSEFGVLSIKLFGNTRYLFTNTGLYTDAGGAKNANGYSFNVEAVTSLPVTITSAGYATLYAPVALTIPTGVTAYTATDMGEYLTLTAVEGSIIPANTGVILAGEATTYNFGITTGGNAEGNALTGSVAAISRPEGSYILATGGSGVG
ncbi:MAG: hypothetical protein IJS59_08485, partial [Bacteroidaceae bacterium]|nr:hypothetical protein [Bacteroidaceae bacterium]